VLSGPRRYDYCSGPYVPGDRTIMLPPSMNVDRRPDYYKQQIPYSCSRNFIIVNIKTHHWTLSAVYTEFHQQQVTRRTR